jgi:hypothetical protein
MLTSLFYVLKERKGGVHVTVIAGEEVAEI